jgi:hypothetical protein
MGNSQSGPYMTSLFNTEGPLLNDNNKSFGQEIGKNETIEKDQHCEEGRFERENDNHSSLQLNISTFKAYMHQEKTNLLLERRALDIEKAAFEVEKGRIAFERDKFEFEREKYQFERDKFEFERDKFEFEKNKHTNTPPKQIYPIIHQYPFQLSPLLSFQRLDPISLPSDQNNDTPSSINDFYPHHPLDPSAAPQPTDSPDTTHSSPHITQDKTKPPSSTTLNSMIQTNTLTGYQDFVNLISRNVEYFSTFHKVILLNRYQHFENSSQEQLNIFSKILSCITTTHNELMKHKTAIKERNDAEFEMIKIHKEKLIQEEEKLKDERKKLEFSTQTQSLPDNWVLKHSHHFWLLHFLPPLLVKNSQSWLAKTSSQSVPLQNTLLGSHQSHLTPNPSTLTPPKISMATPEDSIMVRFVLTNLNKQIIVPIDQSSFLSPLIELFYGIKNNENVSSPFLIERSQKGHNIGLFEQYLARDFSNAKIPPIPDLSCPSLVPLKGPKNPQIYVSTSGITSTEIIKHYYSPPNLQISPSGSINNTNVSIVSTNNDQNGHNNQNDPKNDKNNDGSMCWIPLSGDKDFSFDQYRLTESINVLSQLVKSERRISTPPSPPTFFPFSKLSLSMLFDFSSPNLVPHSGLSQHDVCNLSLEECAMWHPTETNTSSWIHKPTGEMLTYYWTVQIRWDDESEEGGS